MSMFLAMLFAPLCGSLTFAAVRRPRWAAHANVVTGMITFALSLLLAGQVLGAHGFDALNGWFHLDAFNAFLVALTAFVGMTTAIGPYMRHELEAGRVNVRRMRLYHSMFQLFQFGMLLGFTTNNIGVLWVSLELATLATVLLVSLYRTPASIAAAWKYLILCGMGIAWRCSATYWCFSPPPACSDMAMPP